MNKDLKYRESKMVEFRKKTSFRKYVQEIASWSPTIFYKNNGLISVYPKTNRIKWVKGFSEFSKNREDIINNNLDYDFSKDFFQNFQDLFYKIDLPATVEYMENENSWYSHMVCGIKNVYLSNNVTFGSENVFYSLSIKNNCINIFNSVAIRNNCNNIYFSSGITNSSNIFYSKYIDNSSDIWFSTNLVWCSNCMFCNDLSNQSYCINNKQYTKEDYLTKSSELLKNKNKFLDFYANINDLWQIISSENVKWWSIVDSQNIENWYFVNQIKNWKNLIMVWWRDACQEMYDCFQCASKLENYNYWAMASGWWDHLVCNHSVEWSYMYYNMLIESSSYCIWCIGLKNKQFCIFNKQYTKEERFQKAHEIFAQMDKDGLLWKFFPWSMNPFYFNDTAAYLIDDSFTKEEVETEWYLRRDEKIKVDIPEWAELIYTTPFIKGGEGDSKTLDDFQGFDKEWNWKINPEILKKVIVDEKWNYYRIVKMEYDFLMKHWLPLPEIHWLDRIKLGFKFK